MKDNTVIDFEYCIAKISEEVKSDIQIQEKLLDSNKVNDTFLNIENRLNKLYENTRFLEDAIDYCEAFINIKIENYSQEINHILKSIENIRDINKNNSYIEHVIPFRDDMSQKKDRDGEVISTALNNKELLILNNQKDETIKFNNVSKKSDYVPYSNNLDALKDNNTYNTYYIEEKIANKGVRETITITLDTPTKMNYINIKTINSAFENLRLVYINGTEESINNISGIIPEVIVAQIKFDLVCKTYDTVSYFLNKTDLTDDVWKKIKEYEFSLLGEVDTKLEMEEVIARVQGKDTDIFNNNIDTSSEIIEKKMFTYMFGISSIEIKSIIQENDSCFISESINIGKLNEDQFVQLHIEDSIDENACVEYTLLDGDIEVPLLPFGDRLIKNEKLFPALPLRFSRGEADSYVIKKDGITVDISIDDAKLQVLNRFSVDYLSEEKYNYTPINSNVRVKAVIRKYTKQNNPSFIKSIKIRKFGGETLWTDKQ